MGKNTSRAVYPAIGHSIGAALLLALAATPTLAGEALSGASPTGTGTTVTVAPELQKEIGLKVAPVTERLLAVGLSANGRIEAVPGKTSAVNAPVTGRILRLTASPGQAVRRGQTLAVIDSPEIRQLAVEQQFARSGAAADLTQATARLSLAKTTYERERELVELKISARKDFQVAESELRLAQSQVEAAKARIALSGAALSARLSQLGQSGAKAGADGTVALASPIAAVVAAQRVSAGQAVEPGEAIFEVVNTVQVWAVAQVYEKDLGRVRVGQSVEIRAEAYPGRIFRGRVATIDPVVDPETRTVAVRAVLDNPGGLLKPEMFASLSLATGERGSTVTVVPQTAVLAVDGKRMVYVQKGLGSFEPVVVQLGRTSGGFIEVTNGLRAGDRVVVERAFQLRAQTLKSQGGGPVADEDGHAEGEEEGQRGSQLKEEPTSLPGWAWPAGAVALSALTFWVGMLVARQGLRKGTEKISANPATQPRH